MDLPIWHNYRNYFSAELIKTAHLPADRNYIFGGHPHGVYCLGLFANILSNQPSFESLFPDIKVTSATLPINFWLPIWREFMLSLGFVSCERKALTAVVAPVKPKSGSKLDHMNKTKVRHSSPYNKDVFSESDDATTARGTGRALYIAIGGAEEFLLMEPGTMDLVVLKRKGFAKMALVTG
ncbi:diacylglycerol acyltransferase-domain-containing protein [Obelidium mucronatum]|nr:diacylglycerol acyltransferase-domain-containing protein [Obelidium mucronatum]